MKHDRKGKMLSGQLYDPNDEELIGLRVKAHRLSRDYNLRMSADMVYFTDKQEKTGK